MKDFKREHVDCNPSWTHEEYMKNKREKVLEVLKPICEAFGIHDYDYAIRYLPTSEGKYALETFIIEGQGIACTGNSIGETLMELIGYIYINFNETYNPSEVITDNTIKRWWLGNEG